MKYIFSASLVTLISGCAGFVSMATPDDAPPAVQATAVAVDTVILLRAWELIGVFK